MSHDQVEAGKSEIPDSILNYELQKEELKRYNEGVGSTQISDIISEYFLPGGLTLALTLKRLGEGGGGVILTPSTLPVSFRNNKKTPRPEKTTLKKPSLLRVNYHPEMDLPYKSILLSQCM